MSDLAQILVAIFGSVMASSGLWALIQKRMERKDVRTQLLIGLAHDRIVHLGMYYIDRGYIMQDEFENLHDYLYLPYQKMGGNGTAKRVMEELSRIPLLKTPPTEEEKKEHGYK